MTKRIKSSTNVSVSTPQQTRGFTVAKLERRKHLYEFMEMERWNRAELSIGSYLIVLRKPVEYNALSAGKRHTCFQVEVSSTGERTYYPVTLNLEWLIRFNVGLNNFDYVFLIDAPQSILKIGKTLLQENFFAYVCIAYDTVWREAEE